MSAQKSAQNEQSKQTAPKPKPAEQLEQAAPVFLPPTALPAMLWRAENAPESLTLPEARYLQRVMGNRAVNRLDLQSREEGEGEQTIPQADSSLQSILGRTAVITNQPAPQQPDPAGNGSPAKKAPSVQPKLKVNEPDDAFEQEADEMAEAVLRQPMPAPPPPDDEGGDEANQANGPAHANLPVVQRQGDGLGGQMVSADVEQRITGLDGGGAPLPDQERQFFESRMGADFSNVRLHTDDSAAQLSQDLNARAFTVGPNIAFGEGEYQPGSPAGRELLAHELTHTIQQGAADQNPTAARKVQRQETAAEGEEEGPTEEEKAAALAAAAAAEQLAQSVRTTSHSQTEQSQTAAQTEKEAAAAPQEQVAASLAAGPVTPEAEQAREAAVAAQSEEAALVTEHAEQEAATQTQQVMAVPQPPAGAAPPAPGGEPAANGGAGPGTLPAGGEPAPGAGDPAAATISAQTAVANAFTTAENPPDKAPDSPETDPAYQGVAEATAAVAEEQQTHEPATGAAAQAQEAVVIPQTEVESRAQGDQVGEMETAETPGFDAAGFKAALMARIAELAPRTAEEADEFKESDALGGVKNEMQGQVEAEKSSAADPMTEATTAPPDTGAVAVREATPLVPADPGPAPASVNAENAAPPPRGPGEVEAPLEAGSQSIDQQMQDAEITEEQLANANEPEFAAALDAKGEAQTAVAEDPPLARQEESDLIATTQAEAVTTATTALTDMHGQRTEGLTSVSTQQTETMSQDEQKRAEIAAHITGIYERTKTNVETILGRLDTEVAQLFDAGAREAEQAFENYVDARMEAYKEERYGGWLGWAKWAKDKLLGMPGEVNVFYSEGRQLYLDKMDAVIDNVVALIGTTLAEAKAEVANGKQEIQTYVDQLPQDLQTVGQEAADAIQSRFDELEQQIDAKQNELIDTLAQKYNESLQAIDARIEEMKAANRGLIDKAIDAIGAVIGTILELKNLLMQVLASVADAVMTILRDPIGFIGNLISAIGQGLQNFVSNIATHLQTGFIEWLTGTLGGAGIQLPENLFSLEGIFDLVLQILGLTWNTIRARAVAILGEPVVNALETGFELFMIIKEQGLAGLWEYVQEQIATLQETVIDGIKEMLMTEVVEAGVQWLIGLLGGPAGAFIKAAKMIYDIIMWFINNASRIASLVQSIVQSVGAIATGNLSAAAEYVEQSLARFLPVAIGFLASLIGIGDLGAKVRKIIDKVQEPINAAIDWLLEKAKQVAQRIGRALGLSVGDEAEQEQGDGRAGDGEVGETLTFAAEGESHRLWYNVQGENATLMVASETGTVEAKIREWERQLAEEGEAMGENKARATALISTAKNLLGIAESEGDEAAKEKQEADRDAADERKEAEFEQADQEAEQSQHNLADVLQQLFTIFGEELEEIESSKVKQAYLTGARNVAWGQPQEMVQRALLIKDGAVYKTHSLADTETLVPQVAATLGVPKKTPTGDNNPDYGDMEDTIYRLHEEGRKFENLTELATAVQEGLIIKRQVRAVDWDASDVQDTHPEREEFLNLFATFASSQADAAWNLTIRGIQQQRAQNAAGRKHDLNQYYADLGNLIAPYLAGIPPVALWSGGIATSLYARSKGFTTLESTQAGKIYDALKLFRDFSTLGPLWNNLSRQFVRSMTGEVHVFMRVYTPDSVLFRQELPELGPKIGREVSAVRWHVLRNWTHADLTEVDAQARPTSSYTFGSYEEAVQVMEAATIRNDSGGTVTPAEADQIKERLRRQLLTNIPYIGEKRTDAILAAFPTMDLLRGASLDDLKAVPGIGDATAQKVFDLFR